MQTQLLGELIYFSPTKTLPHYLHEIRGFKMRSLESLGDLKAHLRRAHQSALIVVELPQASQKHVESFLKLCPENLENYFIFISQVVENSAFQLQLNKSHFMILRGEDAMTLNELVQLWKAGRILASRRTPRQALRAPVMVKKSMLNGQSPTGAAIQALSEGELFDFSAGGAKLLLRASALKLKDFISLMYMSQQGQWVSVEAQLRWLEDAGNGQQIIGVQFLAMSA
ncbi:PilZ domain protein [compost metagenome]